MIKSNLVGELIMYDAKMDIENWVLCDGKKRDNSDNRYNELINLEIGEKKGDNYFPPNYNTMALVSLERSEDDIADYLSKQVLGSEVGYNRLMNCHILLGAGDMKDYNVVMSKKMNKDETELEAYLSSHPELEVKDISEFRDNDSYRKIIKKTINWAICYNTIE